MHEGDRDPRGIGATLTPNGSGAGTCWAARAPSDTGSGRTAAAQAATGSVGTVPVAARVAPYRQCGLNAVRAVVTAATPVPSAFITWIYQLPFVRVETNRILPSEPHAGSLSLAG